MSSKSSLQNGIILNEELIIMNLDAKKKEDVLIKAFNILLNHGYVKESFIDAIIKREEDFPTGIQTSSIGVAIPHTDVQHVNKAGIAIVTLNKPVVFQEMGTDSDIEVSIIFMLAIKEPELQLAMLQNLVDIFQDESALNRICNAKDKLEIIDIMEFFLGHDINKC